MEAVIISQSIANQIAQQFTDFLNAYHSQPEVYDDALDAQIHEWYRAVLTNKSRKVWPPRDIPYFSPSSANSDPRGLYEKMRGAKRERTGQPPHQGRWTRLGTAIGDMIQRDILFAEKHFAGAPFRFERNNHGEPAFEDFVKTGARIAHSGQAFALYGTSDGIMRYVADDGTILRVGLEIKSKQGTYSQTSGFQARKGPKEDHVKQCVCYSVMYGQPDEPIDYYVILYVNASKKGWSLTPEDFAKTPDILAFGLHITEEMRAEVLDHFASIVGAAKRGEAPELDLDRWVFNDFKRAIALSLSADELAALQRKVSAVQRSSLPDGKKRDYAGALAFIEVVRAEIDAKEAA